MYKVWKNGKCLRLFKTLKGAYSYYLSIIEKCDDLKDCVELVNKEDELLYWY